MARLLVHVEGETEEAFVNEVLAPHLFDRGFLAVAARIVGNARLRRRRGGIRPWPAVKKEIVNHLLGDSGCIATTMVDYYALPGTGDGAWPGRAEASSLNADPSMKASLVELALLNDLMWEIGPRFAKDRFVPFVVIHEFEGLLFSDCAAFSQSVYRPDLEAKLKEIRDQFSTPEDINDSPMTAPSKRIEALLPGYQKPIGGTLAAMAIGLQKIRAQCPHFSDWLSRLESVASTA